MSLGAARLGLAGTAGWVQVGYGGLRWGAVCFVRAGLAGWIQVGCGGLRWGAVWQVRLLKMSKTKAEESKELDDRVTEFLKKGGEIKQVPIGTTKAVSIRRGFRRERIVLTPS